MNSNEEFRVVNIPFFKKLWLSITKFERYPEMATEGVGKAISYLIKLILIFAIIISASMIYNFNNSLKQGIKYIDENISEISYKNGKLQINPVKDETMNIETEVATLIIDTNTNEEETIREYEKRIDKNGLGIIWLNNKVVLYANGVEEAHYYGDILTGLEITEFNKSDFIDFFTNNNKIYLAYFIMMLIATFTAYFITTLIDILILSIFGVLTSYMTGIKMRYRAVFNMSVYALTLSILLKLIYVLVGMFTDFTIKYFDFMYTAIGYICLVAAIFMIKSDVIKQQMELIRLREEKKRKAEEEHKEEKNDEQKEDKKDEKNKEEREGSEEKETEAPDEGTENQGSHA